jgi:hypothetical protein
MTGIEWLRTLHTKQLLIIKNECYQSFLRFGNATYGDVTFSREDLKQVLSERPHIPNGAETKQIRKESARDKARLHKSSS